MTQRQAERWVAIELVAVMVLRTIEGFRDHDGLLGARNYAAMFVAFGFLSVLVLAEPTAELAALLGLLLVLAAALRATTSGSAGGDAAGTLAAFARRVRDEPTRMAQGAK